MPSAGDVEEGAAAHRAPQAPIRCLRCPACGEVMNRVNFARASGVVVQVCRAHGAWLTAGALGEVRRFLQRGGAATWARRRALDAALAEEAARTRAAPSAGGGRTRLDVIDLLAGIPDPWDVRSPRATWRGFARAGMLAAAGGALLWIDVAALWRGGRSAEGLGVGGGILALLAAWRALRRALRDRERRRSST